MNRRGFLGSILAIGAAPAIVRAESVMKLWTPPSVIFHPDAFELVAPALRGPLTIAMIKRECLVILEKHLKLPAEDEVIWGFGHEISEPGTIKVKRIHRPEFSTRRYQLA